MKKLLLTAFLLATVASWAQINPPFAPRSGAGDPNGSVLCNPATGSLASNLYFRKTGTVGWYQCTASPSVWVLWGTNTITGMTDPTTTTGDLIYRSAGGTTRLAGNTTAVTQFLTQTGNGTISAAPVWAALIAANIPDISATYALTVHTHTESQVTALVTDLAAKSPLASPTFTGTTTIPALILNSVTGSTQCLHVNTSGVVSGTGSDCGTGGGGSFYQTVQTNGTPLTQRATLNFGTEFTVADNAGSTRTDVSINAIAESKVTSLVTDLGLKAPLASPTFTGTVTASALTASGTVTLSSISGSTQCLQANSSGVVSGTGASCGAGGTPGFAAITSGTNTTAAFVVGTGATFTALDSNFLIADNGDATKLLAFQIAGFTTATTRTLTIQNASGTVALLSNTLDQFASTTSAGLVTVVSDETGSSSGSPLLVFNQSPTIITPTIASFTNAQHTHVNAGGGGQLTGAAMSSFDISGLTVTSAFRPPAGAGASPATDGVVAFDLTAHALVYGSNGTKVQVTAFSGSAPTSGNCATWAANGKLSDSGVSGCAGLSNPMTTAGDFILAGASGVPIRGAVNTDSVPQTLVSVSGSTSLAYGGVGVNLQTGTTYPMAKTDRLGYVQTNNVSGIAVSIVQAGSTDFGSNYAFVTKNIGNGTATWTPGGTSHFDGNSSLSVVQGRACFVYSASTEYYTICTDGQISSGANVNLTRSAIGVQIGLTGVDLPANRIDQNNASTTSAQFAGVISNPTGSAGQVVLSVSPTLITPTLGVATATSINKVTITQPASGSTLTIADGKTLTISNTMTFVGTDSQTYTMPATSATMFGSTTKVDVLTAGYKCTDAGATDSYACSLSPAISAYTTHTEYCFTANTINTGAATIALNGLAALTIKKPNGGSITSDLANGDIRAGQEVCGIYDGTNLQMTSQIGNSPAGTGTVTSVQNTVNSGSSSGIFTVSGGPVSGAGTIDIAIAGTSGGVPYFSSGTVISSSAALTANSPVLGGGAGVAPKVVAGITTDGVSKLTLGVAGTSVGSTCFTNATSGSICVQPVTGALGAVTISIPARNSTTMGTTSGTLTNGNLASFDASGNLVDSTVTAANAVTATIAATAAKQIAISGGANKTLSFIDFPATFFVPAANCVNAAAGSGWSTGSTPASLCRAGTNNKQGLLSPWGASDTASFIIHLPNDWDSGASLDISLDLTSTDATNGHTVIMQAATSCYKGDGSTTDDVAYNTAQSFGTITLNGNANRTWNATLTGLTKTGCIAGSTLSVKISRTTDTATNVGVYGATVDVARLLTVQAN